MNRRRDQLERELLASMCEHLWRAKAQDSIVPDKELIDPEHELEEAFPHVPEFFRFMAVVQFESEERDVWLDDLGKTIDGEILRRAISGKAD